MTDQEIEKIAGVMMFSALLFAKETTEGFSGNDVLRLCDEFKRQFLSAVATTEEQKGEQ